MKLLGFSYHSVKGGVGKSTLSLHKARRLAAENPSRPVYLLDMDLTGTSLADVLPLCAPDLNLDMTRQLIEKRQQVLLERLKAPTPAPGHPRLRPLEPPPPPAFINDYLLFATQDWDEQQDMALETLLWQEENSPENLFILPSSALPADLERLLPVLFDEEHAAYLEGRLEHLLAGLLTLHEAQSSPDAEICVVIDTPPTLPGLSRSMLSLALRLRHPPGDDRRQLSDDGGMPERLEQCEVRWEAWLVATPDLQDVRAAARWFKLASDDERQVFKFVLNRVPPGDPVQRQRLHQADLHGYATDPQILNPAWQEESELLRYFRSAATSGEQAPSLPLTPEDSLASPDDDLPLS